MSGESIPECGVVAPPISRTTDIASALRVTVLRRRRTVAPHPRAGRPWHTRARRPCYPFHLQSRTSGMSSPCLWMYWVCSTSLSRIFCWMCGARDAIAAARSATSQTRWKRSSVVRTAVRVLALRLERHEVATLTASRRIVAAPASRRNGAGAGKLRTRWGPGLRVAMRAGGAYPCGKWSGLHFAKDTE
jgi:hypothetical protein